MNAGFPELDQVPRDAALGALLLFAVIGNNDPSNDPPTEPTTPATAPPVTDAPADGG